MKTLYQCEAAILHPCIDANTGQDNDMSISTALRQWAARYGSRTALVAQAQRCSYAELDRQVDHLAAGLQQLGLHPGERALVQLPNGSAFLTVCLALMRIGVIPVLAMPRQGAQDIDALCALARPAAYFIADRADCCALADTIVMHHSCLRRVIVDGDPGPRTAVFLSLAALSQRAVEPPSPVPLAADAIALLLLSGGTTGTPKLIPRTHADYLYNFTASAQLCGLDSDTVYLAVLPAAHNFTLACPGIFGTLASGGKVVMMESASCEDAMPVMAREGVTHLALVPALAQLWAQARSWERSDLSRLQVLQVGGARLEPALAQQLLHVFGCCLQQVYGMAEGLLCYTRLDDALETVIHTQGRPLSPLDQLRIVDEHDRSVMPGTVGELLTRGPYTIRHYYGATERRTNCFTADGYFRTGDLVRMDADGNLIVQGRRKEQINRAGEKIAAHEIELALKALAAVQEAVVVAVPDVLLGERICAFLQASSKAAEAKVFTRNDIRAALKILGVSEFKLPDQLENIAQWPLTAFGKIDRQQLLRMAQAADKPGMRSYTERRLKLQSAPLELVTRLLRVLPTQHYTMYEQDDQWHIGIDVAMRVEVHADGTVQRSDGACWQQTRYVDAIAQAMSTLPFSQWCAYGRADFEFGQLRHGGGDGKSDGKNEKQPLLKLDIPCSEIRISAGTALIRCLDAQALPALQTLIEAQDAQPDASSCSPLSVVCEEHQASVRYQAQVAAAVAEMQNQDYQKVILSRQVEVAANIDMIASYRQGRRANTPARSFILRDGAFQAYGFCPETLLEVDADGSFSTQPLAGTRALCGDPADDARRRQELLQDAKEIAEHAVSVKLAMEEMAPISQPGSLAVHEFMQVCQRGSVQHLASRIRARLASGCNAWSAFAQLFPAVTASGIPKLQALASIRRHECAPRGLYSGCVLRLDSHGRMDAGLVLRSVFHDGQRCWMQVGAGVVPLSTPQREWTETCEKLASVARHLQAN